METHGRSPQLGKEMMEGMATAVCEILNREQKVVKKFSLGTQETGYIQGNLCTDSFEENQNKFSFVFPFSEIHSQHELGWPKYAGSRRIRKKCGR